MPVRKPCTNFPIRAQRDWAPIITKYFYCHVLYTTLLMYTTSSIAI